MAYQPFHDGSVVAFQGNPSVLQVLATITNPGTPTSVSGTVGASIIGTVPVTQVTSPWAINGSVSGTVGASVIGTVPTTQAGTRITSIVSTVPSSVLVGTSIFGQLPAGTAPLGSVAALQGTDPWTVKSSISGGIFPVSGSVAAAQIGTWSASVMTNVITSIATAGQVMGSVAALQGTNPWMINAGNSSIINVHIGSIITVEKGSSILAVPVGSVITVLQSPSIVGTYAEDAAHTSADKGIFVMGVRNDNVASFVSANLEYGPQATDAAGRGLTKPFAAEEARVEGYASTVNVSVTTLVAAAGAGIRNYITDVWIANTGGSATLVTFKSGGGASVLGYTIAPAGGGSNLQGLQTPIRTGANETFDFQATTGTSVLYATVKGYKAP